jgi:hypothetical protein
MRCVLCDARVMTVHACSRLSNRMVCSSVCRSAGSGFDALSGPKSSERVLQVSGRFGLLRESGMGVKRDGITDCGYYLQDLEWTGVPIRFGTNP